MLLKRGADANVLTGNGSSPLYICARYNMQESAKILIDYNANINQRARELSTPLYVSAQEGKKVKIIF